MKLFFNILLIFIIASCNDKGSDISGLLDNAPDFANAATDQSASSAELVNYAVSDQTYLLNDQIVFTLEFNKAITINSGVPRINLTVGNDTVYANYTSGSGSKFILFSYTVEINKFDNDGIDIESFELNSASISDSDSLTPSISLNSSNLSGVLVDGIAPSADLIQINTGESFTTNTSANLTLSATDADQMYITTDSGCSTLGTWESYSTSKSVSLSSNSSNTIYFKVKGTNGNESSCISSSIVHDSLAPNSVSGIILSGNASDIASDSATWNNSTDNGPSGILRYDYAVSTTADESGIVSGGNWVDTNSVKPFQIESGLNLSGGTNYYILIRAVDNAGNISSVSASSAFTITVSPEIISNLEATNITTENISLGWSSPQDNGTPITDYEIQIKGGSYSDWTIYTDGTSASTSAIISNLDPETSYQIKVRAFNGTNYSGWSNILAVETLPNIAFFEPGFKAINISGAPKSKLVSFVDNNQIYLNGTLVTTLNKHQTYQFNSADFDQIEATGEFYVAGKLGTGSSSSDQGNATWATQAWVGKEFMFNITRMAPMKLKVYAFTDSTISITSAGAPVTSTTLTAGNGYTFTISNNDSYEMSSTGYIVAFSYGNSGGGFADPVPLLPSSTDIIGIPSSKAMITTGTSSTTYTADHSDSVTTTGTLNPGTTLAISERNSPDGKGLYKGAALRLRSSSPIMAVSNADSNGYCQAPFVPVSFMKSKFGLNTASQYVAFASDRPVTVTITKPDLSTSTITLTRTGSDPKTPYKAYLGTSYPEGTLFEGDDLFQAWYQPSTSTYSGGEDETIMFGW